MPEQEEKCTNCDHLFHSVKCFWTGRSGARYMDCRCKKGVREDDK